MTSSRHSRMFRNRLAAVILLFVWLVPPIEAMGQPAGVQHGCCRTRTACCCRQKAGLVSSSEPAWGAPDATEKCPRSCALLQAHQRHAAVGFFRRLDPPRTTTRPITDSTSSKHSGSVTIWRGRAPPLF